MTYEELLRLLKYNSKESKLFMPNEIFKDMPKSIEKKNHIPFIYSYIYLITWFYRYVKYAEVEEVLDNKLIKSILGYSPANQTLDYLIKRNGLLDQLEYTKTTRDFPIGWELIEQDKDLIFFMSSDLDEQSLSYTKKFDKRFFLKRPILAFQRVVIDEGDEVEIEGTFFDVSNTHNIPFEVFLFCMSNQNLGVFGFYIYSYLKHKNDLFESGYDVSLDNLAKQTGISLKSVNKYLSYLKRHKLIHCIHNMDYFVPDLPKEERLANTYITREFYSFTKEENPYKKIGFKNLEDYYSHLESIEYLKEDVDKQMPF